MENAVVKQLTAAITPVVSIGVGSSIWTVCRRLGLDPESLTSAHLPAVKTELVQHYQKFYASKMVELKTALNAVKGF